MYGSWIAQDSKSELKDNWQHGKIKVCEKQFWVMESLPIIIASALLEYNHCGDFKEILLNILEKYRYYKKEDDHLYFFNYFFDNESGWHGDSYNKCFYVIAWYSISLREAETLTQICIDVLSGTKQQIVKVGAIFLARTGATKEEIHKYISDYYPTLFHVKKYDFQPDYTQLKLNFTLDDIPVRLGVATEEIQILSFLETNCFEEALRLAAKYECEKYVLEDLCFVAELAGAYYGIDENLKEQLHKDMPEELYQIVKQWDEYLEKNSSNFDEDFYNKRDADDEQWLAEYREKAAHRAKTTCDEPEPRASKGQVFLWNIKEFIEAAIVAIVGLPILLLELIFGAFAPGAGVSAWSIIVYIALMIAVSIMKMNWLGWIFTTLFFMSFIWKNGD